MPAYILSTPPIAVGANKLLVDLFNASGSGTPLDLRGIWLVPKLDVAVTGVVGVRVDVYRTSAVGTGGNAAIRPENASASPDPAGGSFARFNDAYPTLPSQITARVFPGGGATISRWLFPAGYMPEETNPSPYLSSGMNLVPNFNGDGPRLMVPENSGLLLKQGPIASVGSVSIIVAFFA